jgi:anti-sigma factor RsiW
MTDRWKDRLSEYLDDELGEREQAELEWHLQSCLDCRRTLGELREVKSRARSLADVEPPSDLWAGITARLENAPQIDLTSIKVIDLRQRANVKGPRRVTLSLTQLAAASIALMLLSGSAVWFALSGGGTRTPATASAPAPVTQVASRWSEPGDYTAAVQ